jgi:hypothetical protein
MRVLIRSVALAVALAAIPLGSVAAHECIVVNRSDTGDDHATRSGRWITVTLEDIFSETENFGLPDLTSAQVDYAVDAALDAGVPNSFTFRSDKTIADEAPGFEANGRDTDGKGVDHFFEVYGETLLGALFAALQNA